MAHGGAGVVVVDRWAVTGKRTGKRWLFRVWHRAVRRWKSKAWADKAPGWKWAHDTQAKLQRREIGTGRAPLKDLGDDFLAELKRRRRSPGHIANVRHTIERAVADGLGDVTADTFQERATDWLDRLGAVEKLEDGTVRRITALELSPSTKNAYLRHLRAVLKFAVRRRVIERNPMAAVDDMAEDKKAKPTFKVGELCLLLRADTDPYWFRFVCETYTGCRIDEAMHLRWEWIRWNERTITLEVRDDYRLKGRKERIIPLLDEFGAILYPMRKASGWVIEDDEARRSTTYGWHFEQFLRRHAVWRESLTPHSTRHTWTALMLATDVNSLQVGAWCAHESTETTKGYAAAQSGFRRAVEGWPRGQFALLEGWAVPIRRPTA